MTKPLYDVPTMCGIMGCLKTRPCPEHGRKAWTGTTPRTRGRRGQTSPAQQDPTSTVVDFSKAV